jgi:hypothetical protein
MGQPSCSVPPLPGVTPPTTVVPAEIDYSRLKFIVGSCSSSLCCLAEQPPIVTPAVRALQAYWVEVAFQPEGAAVIVQ